MKIDHHHQPSIPASGHRLIPPDGGWGWVVLGGASVIGMLQLMPVNCLGLLLVDILETMDTTAATASWLATLYYVTATLMAPISTIICETYSCRTASIFGGLLLSSGMFFSHFATSIEVLFVTFAFLGGWGSSLCRNATLIVLNEYFRKYYGIVTGMTMASISCGRMIFSPVIQLLVAHCGLNITFLAMSAFLLTICVGAILFQPVAQHLKLVSAEDEDVEENSQQQSDDEESHQRLLLTMTGSSENVIVNVTSKYQTMSLNPNKLTCDEETKECDRPRLGGGASWIKTEKCRCDSCCCRWLHSGPLAKLDFGVFQENAFYLVCVAAVANCLVVNYLNVFLPPLVIENGLSAMEGAIILSINSAFEIVGRIGTPLLLHLLHSPIQRCFPIMMLITTVAITGLAATTTFVTVTTFGIFYGICFGGQVGLLTAVMVHFLGPDRLPSVLCFSYFIQGLATLVFGSIIGILQDQTGTFQSCFFLLAGLNFLCALCWIFRRFLVKK